MTRTSGLVGSCFSRRMLAVAAAAIASYDARGRRISGPSLKALAKLWFQSSRRLRESQSANGPEKLSIAARSCCSSRDTRASASWRCVASITVPNTRVSPRPLGVFDRGAARFDPGHAAAARDAEARVEHAGLARAAEFFLNAEAVFGDDQFQQFAQRKRVARRAEQARGAFGELHFVRCRRAIRARRPWRRRRRCGNASPRAAASASAMRARCAFWRISR